MMKRARFERVMNRYKDYIYNYAHYFSGSRDHAEDLTQEVLLKIWRNFDSLREEPGKSWIHKVTRNHCIDWYKKGKKIDLSSSPLDDNDPEMNPPVFHVEQDFERQDLRSRIETAIARLPETLREIIILREIQEMKYEEISRLLDMPLNTVKVNIHRGRRLLREHLGYLYESKYQGVKAE
jgi:RNA polymerase sigma-70 factor (ECF subfamily)